MIMKGLVRHPRVVAPKRKPPNHEGHSSFIESFIESLIESTVRL
jgi:hypothetical protein